MDKRHEKKIDDVLRKIEREAYRGNRFLPIVGPEKGRFYYLIAKAVGAKRILELGTLIGYSALIFYKAMDGKGNIVTVDNMKENINEAIDDFIEAGVKNIEIAHGEAKVAVKKLIARRRKFDIVFLDIEKNEYVDIFDDCLSVLRKGGILLTDNASWDTKELIAFRRMLDRNKKAESVIIPIGDGIAMSVKK